VIPWFGIAMSVIALIMVTWSTRRKGADRVLSSAGAWELLTPTGEQQLLLTNVVEEMSIASGVPVPRIYIIDDPDPNAFVTGADPDQEPPRGHPGPRSTCSTATNCRRSWPTSWAM
jgi:heat shock protein HtpX